MAFALDLWQSDGVFCAPDMPVPDETQKPSANVMWGGRFSASPSALMEAINASIGFDRRMAAQDIEGSIAHSAMLSERGIISPADREAIHGGLRQVLEEIEGGTFEFSTALEDIHMNVESRLKELIGEPAGRLHTARSRNDQVALDVRLWVREAHDRADGQVTKLLRTLLAKAEPHVATVMPGFTHLQAAQPVTFGHHLMAYVEMFGRDRARLRDSRARLNECPLGAAALAGTSFPDRQGTDREGARLRPADPQFPRFGVRPRRRPRISRGGIDLRHAPLAARGGNRRVDVGSLRLHPPAGPVDDGFEHHAAEAQPRRSGTRARQDRAGDRKLSSRS